MIGEIAGLACAAVWAVISLILRNVSTHMQPVAVNALRCLFAAITMLLLVMATGRLPELLTIPFDAAAVIVASGVLGQAVGDAFFVTSARQIGASRALPLSSSSPLLTMILAAIFLAEPVSLFNSLGAVLVFVGVLLIAIPHGSLLDYSTVNEQDKHALALALGAALCYAVSTIILKGGLSSIDPLTANLLRMSTAALIMLLWQAKAEGMRKPHGLDARSLLVLLFAGLLSVVSSTSYVTSVQLAGAARASILTSTSPLFGLPLAIWLGHERFYRRVLAGTLASVVGIWLVLS